MDYLITIDRAWRYRHPSRGVQVLQPGRYRVPEQVGDKIAQRAVQEGMAKREAPFGEMFRPPSGNVSAVAKPEREHEAEPPAKPRQKRGPKRRGKAKRTAIEGHSGGLG